MQIEDWIVSDIPDPILEQASHWILQLEQLEQDEALDLSIAAQTAMRQQFYDWLNQHHLHQLAFSQLSEVWARTSVLHHMEDLIDKSEVLQFPSARTKQRPVAAAPLLVDQGEPISAPAWMYSVVISMAVLGSFIPFFL